MRPSVGRSLFGTQEGDARWNRSASAGTGTIESPAHLCQELLDLVRSRHGCVLRLLEFHPRAPSLCMCWCLPYPASLRVRVVLVVGGERRGKARGGGKEGRGRGQEGEGQGVRVATEGNVYLVVRMLKVYMYNERM